MKKLLFITWDGPQTSYMEGLFMPILDKVKNEIDDLEIHIIQFTWATKEQTQKTKQKAKEYNIFYTRYPITRKPIAIIGVIITVFKGIKFLNEYIKKHAIDAIMPRSTMPSIICNNLSNKNILILFDADGLPIEERVDFNNLNTSSIQYKIFKKAENKILQQAKVVIARSKKAIAYLENNHKIQLKSKSFVVSNGRDETIFKYDPQMKIDYKRKLGMDAQEFIFVYCGSLGPQYGWDEMNTIFYNFLNLNKKAKFLILTGNEDFANQRIPQDKKDNYIVKKVSFEEVPKYLSIADVAFAIREPKPSMMGVAPIKLGEYLLMSLPTIASAGIGDTEELVKSINGCCLFIHDNEHRFEEVKLFLEKINQIDREKIRSLAIEKLSLQSATNSYVKAITKLFE